MPTKNKNRDEIRTILLSLLIARPGPTPVVVLDQDYYREEGERIPWRKLGYTDVVEFLKSMPEHFSIERFKDVHYVRGIASEKTKHVSSLVSRQKKPKYLPSYQFRQRSLPNYVIPQRQRLRIPAEQLSQLVTFVKNNPTGVSLRNAMQMLQTQLPHTKLSINDIQYQLRELSHSLYIDRDMIYPLSVNDVSQEVKNCLQPSTEPQKVPRPPVAEMVGGDEGSDFLEDFSDEDFGLVDYVSSNYPNQSKTNERLATNFAWRANNEQSPMFKRNNDVDVDEYFAANNTNCDTPNTMITDSVDLSTLISKRMKSRLDDLMRDSPEGIWCADLPEKYLNKYKVNLNYAELGFNSVREYVSYLPDIFYMTRTNSTEDFLLYSADKRPIVPDQVQLTKTEPIEIKSKSHQQYDEHIAIHIQHNDDNAPIPADVSPTITKTFAPDDVMNYNDSVDQILVTELQLSDKKYLEVYIVEIFNPSFFWIHLRDNKKEFDRLMDDLSDFYDYKKDKYTIPKIALKKGLNCACVYANRWHRGIIRSVKPDFKVTVLFYDYGTLKTYASEDVYYLHKQFSFRPAQAIPCGLYNVRPCIGDRWKKSVTDQLIDRINETLLALTIVSVDPLNNSMMVILSDTSDEVDVHINEWLIKEKLARYGKMGDAVDMASIMKYIVNQFNQLPTYCFAEENLMSDSRCIGTSTEPVNEETPLNSSKQTHLCRDGLEQQPIKPPPGFAPLDKRPSLSNMSTRSFNDICSFGDTSNVKMSSYGNAEVTTNPFLSDQFVNDNVISNDIANTIFTSIWNENVQLFVKLTEIFRDILGRSPLNKNIFENHMTIQYHLNKFLKNFVKILILDKDHSTTSSSMSLDLARETTSDKVSLAEKTPVNSNDESFVNQKLAGMSNLSLSNPFDDDKRASSTYGSNGYSTFTNWHQSEKFSPRVQVPSPLTPTSAHSIFTNYGSSTTTVNGFFPNADQGSENSSVTKPVTPMMNANVPNNNCNSSSFFNSVNNEFINASFKETNPFKLPMMNDTQIPKSEQMANNYETNPTSYFSIKNLNDLSLKMEAVNNHTESSGFTTAEHINVNTAENYTPKIVYEAGPVMYNKQKKQMDADEKHSAYNNDFKNDHSSKMETMNIHVGSNSFATAEHVNVSKAENYTPRIIYEAGPVMYNTQKKQTNTDVKHNACNSDYKNDHNVSLKGHCNNKKLSSQSANDITILHSKPDSSHIDEGYVTRPPINYTLQNSPPIINNEPNYQQNANERIVSPQTWKQIEIPERWIHSQFQNSAPLQNHNEKSTISTFINPSPHKDWNYNNNKESVTQGMSGMVDLSYIFQWSEERQMDMYKNFCNNPSYIGNQNSIEYINANIDFFFDTSFVFQKIDSVKNTTFIFHTEGEGWMLTHEFVETFTNLKLCSRLMAVLETMNIKVAFKEIQRSDYPVEFLRLDHYPLNAPRDCNKRITSIHLISLQAALSLLHKLKIVTREEIDNAFKKKEFWEGSVLPDMWEVVRDISRVTFDIFRAWRLADDRDYRDQEDVVDSQINDVLRFSCDQSFHDQLDFPP